MTPQDLQSPQDDQNAAAQPAVDLNAQIPPSYAPAAGPAPAPAGAGSPLQDALNAQLSTPPAAAPVTPAPTAAPTPVAAPVDPAAAAIDQTMAVAEPDPMTGFTNPAIANAPAAMPVAPVASVVEPSAAPVTSAPDVPVAPAPTPTQAYDPSQDVGVGAPASSYPSAPEPLPPNPLEMDAASAPQAPFLPEQPIAPEPVAAAVPAEPAPMPAAPAPVEAAPPVPSPDALQQAVDPMANPVMPSAAAPVDSVAAPPTDPTLQSMLEDPAANPAAGIDPYADPALMAAASGSAGKPKGGKGIFMAVGIGAAVLIFGVIVLALVLGRKTTTEVPADSLSGDSQQSQSVSTEPTITVPEGYTAVVKACYEFGLPTDNTVPTDDTSCKLDATFGSQGVSTIAVLPSITAYADLDKAVVASKEANKITAANTVSERQITLGGFDAKEVVFNAGTTAAPQNKTMIVVLLKEGKYKLDGEKITAMEINMSSNDEFTKSAVSTLESTWSWK